MSQIKDTRPLLELDVVSLPTSATQTITLFTSDKYPCPDAFSQPELRRRAVHISTMTEFNWQRRFSNVNRATSTPSSDDDDTYDFAIFYNETGAVFRSDNGELKPLQNVEDLPVKTFHVRTRSNVYMGMNSYETNVVKVFTREILSGRLQVSGAYDCVNGLAMNTVDIPVTISASAPVPIILGNTATVFGTKQDINVSKGGKTVTLHTVHIGGGAEIMLRHGRLYMVGFDSDCRDEPISSVKIKRLPPAVSDFFTPPGTDLDKPVPGKFAYKLTATYQQRVAQFVLPTERNFFLADWTHLGIGIRSFRQPGVRGHVPIYVGEGGSIEEYFAPGLGTRAEDDRVLISKADIRRAIKSGESTKELVETEAGINLDPAIVAWTADPYNEIDYRKAWRRLYSLWSRSNEAWTVQKVADLMRMSVSDVLYYLDGPNCKFPIETETGCYLPLAIRAEGGLKLAPIRLSSAINVTIFPDRDGDACDYNGMKLSVKVLETGNLVHIRHASSALKPSRWELVTSNRNSMCQGIAMLG